MKQDAAARVLRRMRGKTVRTSVVRAVDSVDLTIAKGEVVGLVGESGCGKSTLGRMVAGIISPSAGQVLFNGQDRGALTGAAAKSARLRVQMIFQGPVCQPESTAAG